MPGPEDTAVNMTSQVNVLLPIVNEERRQALNQRKCGVFFSGTYWSITQAYLGVGEGFSEEVLCRLWQMKGCILSKD